MKAKVIKGKYVIKNKIARGGMAEIYRAEVSGPLGFKKDVCIKKILPQFSTHPGFESMFLDEARIAASLHHANIVQVFDFDRDDDGSFFIVMEFVDGFSLKFIEINAWRRGIGFDEGFVATVGKGILSGLHHAWEKEVDGKKMRVVHRDLSPHNILISRDGQVKIADFGIAKAVFSVSRTSAGVMKGKINYMSPEQASGVLLDCRSDLYSLGIIMWEMLTGRKLFDVNGFDGINCPPTIEARKRIPSVRCLRKGVSRQLDDFVMKLLMVDLSQRPATARHALELLDEVDVKPWNQMETGDFLARLFCDGGMGIGEAGDQRVTYEKCGGVDSEKLVEAVKYKTISTATMPNERLDRWNRGRAVKWFLPVFIAGIFTAIFTIAGGFGVNGVSGKRGNRENREAEAGSKVRVDAGVGLPCVVKMMGVDSLSSGASTSVEGEGVREKSNAETDCSDSRKVQKKGRININVKPWAEVEIDGKGYGFTPIRGIVLSEGRHVVVVRNRQLGVSTKRRIYVRAGKVTSFFIDLNASSRWRKVDGR